MSQPKTTNSNDAHYNDRLAFIDTLFKDTLKLKVLKAKPIAYEENFPFPYNNFVYIVEVEPKSFEDEHTASHTQPGTHLIPRGLCTFVIRLSNPVWGYNDKVRVENEVAALSIAREALEAQKLSHLVPRVFGWGSAAQGHGWILQERMSRSPLMEAFPNMDERAKTTILNQMADILSCFQRYNMPSSVHGFGGLGFDSDRRYVSTALSILDAGPFPTYEGLVRAIIESKLSKADEDPWVRGWHDDNVRSRIDKFLAQELHQLLSNGLDNPQKCLVHADFTTDNLLYDEGTKRVTALLDFDFSHISAPVDEFFRSLGPGIGSFPAPRDDGDDTQALRRAMLEGFPDPLPSATAEVDWPAAKVWDDALRARDLARPSTIPQMDLLADLFWLSGTILPFKLCNEVVVSNSSEEQLLNRKKEYQAKLVVFLEDYGF